jgi:hypothetical protein
VAHDVTLTVVGMHSCLHTFLISAIYDLNLQAVALVMKTRWDRYRLHMMPLYQFDHAQLLAYIFNQRHL